MTALLVRPRASHGTQYTNNADAFERATAVSKWKDFMDAKIEDLERKRGKPGISNMPMQTQQLNSTYANVFNDCLRMNQKKVVGGASPMGGGKAPA